MACSVPPARLMFAACALVAAVVACDRGAADARPKAAVPAVAAPTACDTSGARAVVERLGARLQRVSLLAPDSTVEREIREAYAPFVTPELLAGWLRAPALAPGRHVSSPWPDRIDIVSIAPEGAGRCRVVGEVVYTTSAETPRAGAAEREPVVVWVTTSADAAPRISAYRAESTEGSDTAASGMPAPASLPADSGESAAAAAAVVRRYYAAIERKEYRRAYALWGGGVVAGGQSYDDFAAGFAGTAHVEVEVGEPGRVEGAAGSRFVEVPVVVRAVTRDGTRQRFAGTYTLRRVVVEGASAAQRAWHIDSARLVQTQ